MVPRTEPTAGRRAPALTPTAAVLRRDFFAYFASPTGYVFITLFLCAMAYLAFNSATFFANNLADFSALNALFYWLPVVFVPAITMTAWAEERKLGTDELLLTLPVRDIEAVLGKYLAALGVYTVSLGFATTLALVLAWLGDPDWGLIGANFLGYWFVGAALIPLGLVASALTGNVTVAFILGTAFCLVAVFAERGAALLLGLDSRLARGIGVRAHFENFSLGIVSLPDVLYFALLAGSALYVNMVLLGRRHWAGGRRSAALRWHYVARVLAVAVSAASLSILAGRWLGGARLDVTAERLNSISPETVRLIKSLPGDRTVYVQAYVSPNVPESYVRQRRSLLRVLRQIDAVGGDRIKVSVHDTELYSDEAREAEDRFDIRAQEVPETSEGRFGTAKIFMGVAMTCGPEQEIIKFLDRGLSAEYEIVRTLRAVTNVERRTVGILRTDARLFGGFDFRTMSMEQPWDIVEELRKQYRVVQAEPDTDIDPDIDVLVAALPSSLTQEQMDVLAKYIRSGRAALLLLDPLPIQFPQLSPSLPRSNPRGYGPEGPPEPKGDIDGLLAEIGLRWHKDVVVWDAYNPLPKLADLPPEIVFVSPQAGGEQALNPDEPATRGLSRVALMFPGALEQVPGTSLKVSPLLRSGSVSGELMWSDVIRIDFLGMSLNPNRRYVPTGERYVLAARVSGEFPPASAEGTSASGASGAQPAAADPQEGEAGDRSSGAAGANEAGSGAPEKGQAAPHEKQSRRANVIAVADLDLISQAFFQLRRQGDRELRFDNITFILNCVDTLAGDDALIALRNRRPRYRTLTAIESRRKAFEKAMLDEQQSAESEAARELAEAQKRLDDKVNALKARKDLDERTKAIMVDNLQRVENNKLEAAKAEIEARKQQRIQRARRRMYRSVRRIEDQVRLWALLLPPLPAILIGLAVFGFQGARERRAVPLSRAARHER